MNRVVHSCRWRFLLVITYWGTPPPRGGVTPIEVAVFPVRSVISDETPKETLFMFVDVPKSGLSSLFDFLLYIFHASRPSTCQLYKTGKKLMNLYLFRCPLPIICENYHLPTGNSSHAISEQLKAFLGMGWVNINTGGGVTHTICRRQICKVFLKVVIHENLLGACKIST